jgi:hypothetical protein
MVRNNLSAEDLPGFKNLASLVLDKEVIVDQFLDQTEAY